MKIWQPWLIERGQRACAAGGVLSKNQVNRIGASVTSLLHIELQSGRGSSE